MEGATHQETISGINVIVPAKASFLKYIPKSILQQPFELLLSFMCITSGITYAIGNIPVAAIDKSLPSFFIHAWGFCLFTGGILLFIGVVRTSPLIQRAGLSLLAPTSFVYATLLLKYIGTKSLFTASILIGFGIACLIKDYTIKIATMSIKQVFRDHG